MTMQNKRPIWETEGPPKLFSLRDEVAKVNALLDPRKGEDAEAVAVIVERRNKAIEQVGIMAAHKAAEDLFIDELVGKVTTTKVVLDLL